MRWLQPSSFLRFLLWMRRLRFTSLPQASVACSQSKLRLGPRLVLSLWENGNERMSARHLGLCTVPNPFAQGWHQLFIHLLAPPGSFRALKHNLLVATASCLLLMPIWSFPVASQHPCTAGMFLAFGQLSRWSILHTVHHRQRPKPCVYHSGCACLMNSY